MKIRVLWAGKTKKPYFRDAIQDYSARINRFVPFEIVEIREESATDTHKERRVRNESRRLGERKQASTLVTLDSSGKQMTSEDFANWLEKITGDVDFLIGGPAGLIPPENALKLSFGRMTLPHELARVVLLEQIFRALTIVHKLPYHK